MNTENGVVRSSESHGYGDHSVGRRSRQIIAKRPSDIGLYKSLDIMVKLNAFMQGSYKALKGVLVSDNVPNRYLSSSAVQHGRSQEEDLLSSERKTGGH